MTQNVYDNKQNFCFFRANIAGDLPLVINTKSTRPHKSLKKLTSEVIMEAIFSSKTQEEAGELLGNISKSSLSKFLHSRNTSYFLIKTKTKIEAIELLRQSPETIQQGVLAQELQLFNQRNAEQHLLCPRKKQRLQNPDEVIVLKSSANDLESFTAENTGENYETTTSIQPDTDVTSSPEVIVQASLSSTTQNKAVPLLGNTSHVSPPQYLHSRNMEHAAIKTTTSSEAIELIKGSKNQSLKRQYLPSTLYSLKNNSTPNLFTPSTALSTSSTDENLSFKK